MHQNFVVFVFHSRLYKLAGCRHMKQEVFILPIFNIKCQMIGPGGRKIRANRENMCEANLKQGVGEAVPESVTDHQMM
jgi:hypothetical protein